MEPKTPALGKTLELLCRKLPVRLHQKNPLEKLNAIDLAPDKVVVVGKCTNSVIRGFKSDSSKTST